jgi:hypothetical protein
MNLHLSEEAARIIEAQLARTGFRTPSEFVENLLHALGRAETSAAAEKHSWQMAQENAAAKLWDNDADARYDAL